MKLSTTLAVAVAAAVVAFPAGANAAVYPEKQCATYNATTGTVQVRLAAVNTGPAIVAIPPGDDNFFAPPPPDRDQPNQFLPGFTPWDLTLRADSGDLNWTLDGTSLPAPFSTAAAGLPFERPCAYRGPEITGAEPATLTIGGDVQTMTIFGQGLGAGATVAIDGVAHAITPSAATPDRLDVPVTIADTATPGAHDLLVTDADGNQTGCRGCVRLAPPVASTLPSGPQGEPGPQGPSGPAGAAAPTLSARTLRAPAKTVRAGRLVSSKVSCPSGMKVLSGGYDLTPARAANPPLVLQNAPAGSAGWHISARGAQRAKAFKLTAYAVCA